MDPKKHNDDQTGIGSTEYRTKLLTKLNCLMAVLEVAITKIDRTMELPSANQDRLSKIRANLQNTLSICTRAKETLERSSEPSSTRALETRRKADSPKERQRSTSTSMSYRDYVELSSIEEYQKFKKLPPIDSTDLDSADLDDLLRKLYEA